MVFNFDQSLHIAAFHTMKNRTSILFCLLALFSCAVGQPNNTSTSITCNVLVSHIQYEEADKESRAVDVEYLCSPVDTNDGILFQIPTSLMYEKRNVYARGGVVVEIHGGHAIRGNGYETEDEIALAEGAYVVILKQNSDRLLSQIPRAPKSTGIHSALVVRVTTPRNSIPLDASTISKQVFGSGFSLKTVYNQCSWGQLKFTPAEGKNVNNGVLDIFVNVDTNTTNRLFLENAMSSAVQAHFGSTDLWDHILYCVPQPTGKWIAYAYMNMGR